MKNFYLSKGYYDVQILSSNVFIKEKEGIQFFDAGAFRTALGIGKEGAKLKNIFNNALPGPTVTKLKIFDPAQGIYKEFDDAVYELSLIHI